MSNLPDTWTAFSDVKSLGGRPHMQKRKGKETGKLILPTSIAENAKYINRASESLGGGCHLPSIGEEYSAMSTTAMTRQDRNKITRRFAAIEREEKGRYKGTRTGYSVKIPIPNGLTIEQGIEILTGKQAGPPEKDGGYLEGSIYALADARLKDLAQGMVNFGKDENTQQQA